MNGVDANQEEHQYVTLISSDGFEFTVLREATMISHVVKSMLDPSGMCSAIFGPRALESDQLTLPRFIPRGSGGCRSLRGNRVRKILAPHPGHINGQGDDKREMLDGWSMERLESTRGLESSPGNGMGEDA